MTTLGAQYYRPPNPPRDDWSRDLARMRETGLDTVKYWACWSWMEPRPGEIDFDDLDVLMDLAARHDLRVVINTILENVPYWLAARLPEARYIDQEGRAFELTAAMNTPGGGWPGLCFDNESVADAADSFLERVVTRYRGHPALAIWDVWNEPHLEPASYEPDRMYCYCSASLERFTTWLQARYAEVEHLDAAWARRFGTWSEVAPPRRFEAVPDMLDWRGSWFANLRRWLDRRVATVRSVDPDHPVMTHVALSGFTGQLATHTLDEFTLGDAVDVFGTSSFPTWLMADDLVEHLFDLETARDAAPGAPFWQAELQGGRGRRDARNPTGQPDPRDMTLWMWNALAAGATGIVFWQWRPELLGPESPGYGLCSPAGDPTPRSAAVSAFSRIAALPELDGRRVDDGAVGLLLSRDAALLTYTLDRDMRLYRDAVMGAYRVLIDLDVPVRLVHADDVGRDGIPAGLDRLLWPMPSVASTGLAGAIRRFVERGGRVLAEALPGEFEPNGRRQPITPGSGLDALFGIREIETDTGDLRVHLTEGGTMSGAWMRAGVAVTDADVLGRFSDGSAAITVRQTGDGHAIHIGTLPFVAYERDRDGATRDVINTLLDLGAISRPIDWQAARPGLVSRRSRTRDGHDLRFALNWTDEPASFDSSLDGRLVSVEVVQGTPVVRGDRIELPPRSGALLVGSSAP